MMKNIVHSAAHKKRGGVCVSCSGLLYLCCGGIGKGWWFLGSAFVLIPDTSRCSVRCMYICDSVLDSVTDMGLSRWSGSKRYGAASFRSVK